MRRTNPKIGTREKVPRLKARPMGDRLGWPASAAVVALSAVFAFRKLDDFDTWWHLAAGRWIAEHGVVPVTDTLSYTVRGHPWINLEWGFDLVVYLLFRAGGPALLCLTAAAGFAAAVWLLLRLVRPHLGLAERPFSPWRSSS